MTYKGHVENGVVVFDEPVLLEDGTPVSIEIAATPQKTDFVDARSRFEHYRHLIGIVNDLPEDLAENHDKYLEEDYRQ